MITNLRLQGKYSIEIKDDKIYIDDETIHIKEIPFIRYDLKEYGQQEKEYIEQMMKKFNKSVHLVELQCTDKILQELELIDNEDIAKYVYLDITDQNIEDGTIGKERLDILKQIKEKDYLIESIILKDVSTKLSRSDILKFKDELHWLVDKQSQIGVCNSPYSFNEDACLTALKARELLMYYSEDDECAIPSARHECMECCGCMKHKIIDKDIINTRPVKKEVKKSKNNLKKTDSKTAVKTSKKKGTPILDW